MTDSTAPLASLRRLRAVLALRGTTLSSSPSADADPVFEKRRIGPADSATYVELLSSLAEKIGCTPSHLRVVVLGRREASPALRTKLEQELRPDEWGFARGETDVLRDVSDDASPDHKLPRRSEV